MLNVSLVLIFSITHHHQAYINNACKCRSVDVQKLPDNRCLVSFFSAPLTCSAED